MQGVTHLEVFSSVFNITKIKVTNQINKNTFAIYTPRYWENPKNIKKLNELIEQRKVKEIVSDVQEVKKRGFEMKIGVIVFRLSDLEDY